jgi:hypothetical protein
MKIGVVVPVLSNFEGAVTLIHSIKSHHQIGIYIQPQWRNQVALAAAWNNGFDEAVAGACEYILISNDDIILSPHCIDGLVSEFERLESENVVLVTICNIRDQLSDPLDILNYPQVKVEPSISDHPNYSCFLVHKTFFDRAGRFDENFWPAWYEDNDSHYRIHLLGLRAVATTAAPGVHVGGVTTHMLDVVDSGQSKAYFLKKWGSVNLHMNEKFRTPYDDPNLTPREWV